MLLYHGSNEEVKEPQLIKQNRSRCKMNQEQLNVTLAFITPGIIQLLMDNRRITAEAASMMLYNSKLYKFLEDEKTKLWHLSYPILYDMLEKELSTGEIPFPEEQ